MRHWHFLISTGDKGTPVKRSRVGWVGRSAPCTGMTGGGEGGDEGGRRVSPAHGRAGGGCGWEGV